MKIDVALTPETADALLAACLMAAMCDGDKSEVEMSEIRRISDELGSGDPAALSFCTTYALGHLAEQYRQGGQRLDANLARPLFETLKSKASALHSNHLSEIQAKAGSITLSSILQMVSGQGPV